MISMRSVLAVALDVPYHHITEEQAARALSFVENILKSNAESAVPKVLTPRGEVMSQRFGVPHYMKTLEQLINDGMAETLLLARLCNDKSLAHQLALESVRDHQYPRAIIACAAARMHTEKVFSD